MKRNTKSTFTIFFSLILVMVFLPLTRAEGAMSSYCITPPFLSKNIPPNVLILLDNSGSMNCLAYQSSYDPTNFVSGNYYGYFDPTKNYKYTTAVTPNRWIPTADAITAGTSANPIASGNLLNWITMSRQDIAKKLLIGGRASSGAYAAADRTTNPVKLYGNSDADTGLSCATNHKDFDNPSAGPIIYPFVGDWKYTVALNHADTFSIAFNDPTTVKLYPTSNYSSASPAYAFPAAWVVSTGTQGNAYQRVDETTANTTDYVTNKTTTEDALFLYDKLDAALSTASGSGFGISSITVYAYAKKTGSSTVNLQGVLRLQDASAELESASGTSALTTSFNSYPFNFPTNPQTGAAWQWSDLTGSAVGSLLGFGFKSSRSGGASPTSSYYPTVSQVYIQINLSVPANGGPYNIIVDQGATPASGILDTMSSDVRFGLAQYNSGDGGKIVDYVDYGAITGIVSSINNVVGSTSTPLGETLYEIMRYFRQDSTNYSSSDYVKGCSGAASGTSSCAASSTPNSKDPYFYDFTDPLLTDQYVPCAKSFVIVMTDGESTSDTTMPGSSTSAPYANCSLTNIKACSGRLCDSATGICTTKNPRYAGTTVGQTYSGSGTDYMIDVAYWGHTNDMRPGAETDVPTKWRQSIPENQTVSLYTVYLFGSGSTFLKDVSIYGGFNDLNLNNRPDCTTTPSECYKDSDGDGVIKSDGSDDPVTYYEGDDGYKLEASITNALTDILRRVTSGTAASVLASGEGSGANLVQAVYYPAKRFGTDDINWIGRLTNLWYYVDPFANFSNIMEDNGSTTSTNPTPWSGDKILDLNATSITTPSDYIIQMYFDKDKTATLAKRWTDPAANGVIGTQMPTVSFEDLGYLWEAGTLLWRRDLGTSPRTIKTTIGGGLIDFTTANAATLNPYLNTSGTTTASNIINWITGYDIAGYRSRTVKVDTIDTTPRVWKLGDVINSTPRIMSWKELNYYGTRYGDSTYGVAGDPNATADPTQFTTTAAYKKRGMVFAGGNDGMLHAFKFGTLQLDWGQSSSKKARLLDPDTGVVCSSSVTNPTCGQELWAFIPKNALPYLQYMADKDYCHVYSIDLTPTIFDASIGGAGDTADTTKTVASWRTILIGGMRSGGACKPQNASCSTATPNGVCAPATVSGASVGYSSYFALDITDPKNPSLLWEFSDPALGFTTTGPAVMRIGDKTKNGHWFAVFGSGPTGPISTADHQFLGRSDQHLKLFILDLKTGSLLRAMDTGISNAFAGSLASAAMDPDDDYQDELAYVPFVKPAADGTWTDGGIGRLMTMRDPDPSKWTWNKLIEGVGPVTSAAGKLEDKTVSNLWVLFGTGRYYYAQNGAFDDPNGQRRIFGIKDPCEAAIMNNYACTEPDPAVQFSDLTDVTSVGNVLPAATADASPFKGWYISLDLTGVYTYPPDAAANFLAERVITDPLVATSGLAYFTTYKSSTDFCQLSGNSFLWVVQYNTGGPPLNLKGLALVQTSTGAIQQLNLSSALTDAGGRKGLVGLGQPPVDQGLSVQLPAAPVRRTLHVKER